MVDIPDNNFPWLKSMKLRGKSVESDTWYPSSTRKYVDGLITNNPFRTWFWFCIEWRKKNCIFNSKGFGLGEVHFKNTRCISNKILAKFSGFIAPTCVTMSWRLFVGVFFSSITRHSAMTRQKVITRHGNLIDYGDRSLMKVQREEETATAMEITNVWMLIFYIRMK